MSDRQQLAEHGTSLCVAALGIIAGGVSLATALLPVAVLTMVGYDKWEACDAATVRRARKRAEAALREVPDISDADVSVAVTLLKESQKRIRFEPSRMARAVASGDIDGALLTDLFGAVPDLDPGVRRAIQITLRATFDIFRQSRTYRDVFTQAMVMDLLAQKNIDHTLLTEIKEDTGAIRSNVEKLVAQKEDLAREFGIKEGLLIALARRYAEGNESDFDAVLRGLERALEAAHDQAQKGQLAGNTDTAVNDVIARVEALNDDGDIDRASALIAAEEARAEAGLIRLYDTAIAQAILTRDAEAACSYEVKKLALEVPDPAAQFGALRDVFIVWYTRGRDNGLNFDLEVAIALARACHSRATDADELGKALNNLGVALQTLGAREAGTAQLEESVAAYRAALQERTRERVPLDWAMTQMNLGNALRALGEREAGTARLEEAVAAYRAALEEWTRERLPLDWALTQMNLGNALQALGEREPGTARLEEAVAAYGAALEEQTRESMPLDWAMTQVNLGNALQTLGAREAGTARLEEAVAAYRAALQEMTQERVPLDWARTQMNLGTALKALGEREAGTARLEEALAAYRGALKEATRGRVPLEWARAQMNLGTALKVLGEREAGTARLEEARAAYRAALQERTRERVPLERAITQFNLSLLDCAVFDKTGDPVHLDAAQGHLDAARKVFEQAQAGHYLAACDEQQAGIDSRRQG